MTASSVTGITKNGLMGLFKPHLEVAGLDGAALAREVYEVAPGYLRTYEFGPDQVRLCPGVDSVGGFVTVTDNLGQIWNQPNLLAGCLIGDGAIDDQLALAYLALCAARVVSRTDFDFHRAPGSLFDQGGLVDLELITDADPDAVLPWGDARPDSKAGAVVMVVDGTYVLVGLAGLDPLSCTGGSAQIAGIIAETIRRHRA